MREIEIKAVLKNEPMVLEKLAALGCEFSPPVVQDDTVYVKDIGSLDTFLGNDTFVRLREQGGETLLTVKHYPDRQTTKHHMPFEHETTVGSRAEMEEMLKLLGFQEAARIRKSRRKAKLAQREICLDEVEGLGAFIEVEELAEHDADQEKVKCEILGFLRSLGIEEEDLWAERYDAALIKKRQG